MKDVTSEKTNFGRFAYQLATTIGDEVNDGTTKLVVAEALPNLGFRAVGSEVEKALVKAGNVPHMAYEKDGKSFAAGMFSKEVPRSAVAYSLETSKIIATAAQEKLDKICKAEGYPSISFIPMGEHVFGEGGDKPTKEATELWTRVQALQGQAFEDALKKLGLDEDYTDESGILACKKTLQAARAKAQAEMAASLALS